jgi:hypothetical protein
MSDRVKRAPVTSVAVLLDLRARDLNSAGRINVDQISGDLMFVGRILVRRDDPSVQAGRPRLAISSTKVRKYWFRLRKSL